MTGGFVLVDDEPRVEGEPWWDQGDCAELIRENCVATPFGIVLIDEIFDVRGRPVDSWSRAARFEGVVVAGTDVGVWVQGPLEWVEAVSIH